MTEKDVESYLYLQIFCESFNDFNGGLFTTGFCFILLASPILFIYLALVSFHVVNILVYLIAPSMCVSWVGLILLFLPQHAKVQLKSKALLQIMQQGPIRSTRREFSNTLSEEKQREWIEKRVQAFRPLRIEISFFGSFSLDTPAVMMDQLFNNILLLLSL